jgi:uncharacterized protein (TIGR04540 family)
MEILKNPTTVKLLAAQLKRACDEYISLKIDEKKFKDLLIHYASAHGKKLFSINGFNSTIINRIGKKRIELINIMLSGFQMRLL